jgi:uncharacterized coiled-coil protein SlyX
MRQPATNSDARLEKVESQVAQLKKALGTLADAVSEEFDSLHNTKKQPVNSVLQIEKI